MTPPKDGERLTRYLLGELPPAEAEAVEDECFADDRAQEALEAADDDLVDAFVRGTLPPPQRAAFEARYAASPALRARVQFARALLRTADERAVGSPRLTPRRPALVWTVAAALAAASAAWIAADVRGVRRQRDAVRAAEASRQQARELEARLRGVTEELERSRAGQTLLQELLRQARQPLRIASFALASGATRDLAGVVLRVPPDATVVRLHLQHEGPPPRPPIEAVIQTAEGDEVWSARGPDVRSTARGAVVTLSVGAEHLPPGDYVATLSRLDRGGHRQEAAAYAFRTQR